MDGSETVCKNLHSRLLSAVKQCQVQFGGRSEVATDQDECVQTLCCEWEAVLVHGLKPRRAKGFIGKSREDDRLWQFVREFLTHADSERLQSLSQVHTTLGSARAWLRTALNERMLEAQLNDMLDTEEKLRSHYHPSAFMLDQEYASTLPIMAAGLNSIIFALPLDDAALDREPRPLASEMDMASPPLLESDVLEGGEEEFKAVSLLKRKKQGRKSDGQLGVSVGVFAEEQAEVVSHSSSQQSLTSYEDGDMVNFDPLGGLEPPVCSKSVDQLLEDAYDASKHVLGLTNKEEEEPRGNHSTVELRQALLSVVRQKDILEQRCSQLEGLLFEEQQRTSEMEGRVEELREQLEQADSRQRARMDEIERENDVLRDQLKQYVTMIQTQEQQQTQPPQEDEEPPTPTEENSSGLGGASTMEEHMHGKLSEMANMYGEVMELNSDLHKQIQEREKDIQQLRLKLLHSTSKSKPKGRPPEEKCPVNIWIPSVIRETKGGETYHVYQVLVNVHNEEWNVYRRYSEFRAFHKVLQRELPEIAHFSFPSRKGLLSKSAEVLEDRRLRLQEFLRTVIRTCSKPATISGRQRPAYITHSTSKSKFIKILPFFTEKGLSDHGQPDAEGTPVLHYNGL